MRRFTLYLFLLSGLVLLATAWTKDDHEIFRLRDEVEAAEGEGISFYDFLGIKPSATVEDVNQALRKKSRTLHPDKAKHSFIASRSTGKPKKPGEKRKPGVHVSKGPSQREIQKFVKEAGERWSRLTVVANVLKGSQRERYDHFLRHGFPRWRGTGYYYTRYRPGLGTVLFGLFLMGGGVAHYFVLTANYRRQYDFMERYIRHARKTAWGDESGIRGIPGVSASIDLPSSTPASDADPSANLNRKQKREMERQNKKDKSKGKANKSSGTSTPRSEVVTGPSGEKRRVTAENGKILVVDSSGNVFLEEEDEDGETQEYLLDLDEIVKPTIWDTAVVKFPVYLYRRAFDPFLKSAQPVASDEMPPTDRERKSENKSEDIVVPELMSASQITDNDFEMVDSSGIEEAVNAASANAKLTKRGKKSSK